MTILAFASIVNYDCQSDAPIWSITSSGINYDRNKFIIQATDARAKVWMMSPFIRHFVFGFGEKNDQDG